MASWVRRVLVVTGVAVLAVGCVDGGEESSEPSPEVDSVSESTAASEPAAPGTGAAAPRPGKPGFDVVPECFGRPATILGSPDDDRITGTRKRDVVVALAGNDVVTLLGAEDRACLGVGDDIVRITHDGFPNVFDIDLGAGDDLLRAVEADSVFGGTGDDRIVVQRDPATVSGGPGADYLRSLSTKVERFPENGPCLNFRTATRPVRVNLHQQWARGEGRDRVINFQCVTGSPYADVLIGSDELDGIWAGAGLDVVRAGAGNDSVDGGPQADRIFLGPGSDYANGSSGWDRLYGEDGDDNLEGWSEGDYLEGGAGNDELYAALFCAIGGNSYDTAGLLDGHPNELFGGPGDDYLVGDKGNDRLDGGEGYDVGQGGYRDGRLDWIEGVERTIDGCLRNPP